MAVNHYLFMKKILFLVCVCFLSVSAFAGDDELSIKNKAKAELAKQKMYGGQYKGALAKFNEILRDHPGNGTVLYYAADCHFKLGEKDKALELLEKARNSAKPNPEAFLLLGQIYQSEAKVDEALAEFNAYKSKGAEAEVKESFVDLYISQCNMAKTLMAKPVEVKIENLGQNVNSKFDDKSPSVTLDGKKLYFNSRRPVGTDDPIDVEGDGQYFENIYYATWDSARQMWNEANEIPGQINERGVHSACTGISQDGKQIFIYKNNLQDNTSRGGDIFVSKVMNNKWKTPEAVGKPVNTTYFESGACISPDGKTLYFVSECPKYGKEKGYGGADIWMVQRISKTEWGKPVNLGPEINTQYQEGGIFLAADGKTLFFCSNNPNSMGDLDVFRTVNENGKWSKPENLGYPINTVRRDGPLCLTVSGKYAYFSSARPGGLGENDVYRIDLMNYSLLDKGFAKKTESALSIMGGLVRDGYEGKPVDGAEVTFYSESGEKLASVTTSESGEYLMTLKGGSNYTVKVSKDGFKTTEEKVSLPAGKDGEAYKLEKQFLLNK
jgi:tetratricopeptide (TPR) repeat protein